LLGVWTSPVSTASTLSAQGAPPVNSVSFKLGEFISPTVTWAGLAAGDYRNLDMSTYNLDSGATAVTLMASGNLAGAADLSQPPLVIGYNRGVDLKVVWVTSFTPAYFIVKKGLKSLSGGTFSAPGGSVTQFYLNQYLQSRGIGTSDYKFANLPAADAVAAFRSGAVDGVMSYPPYSEQLTAFGGVTLDTAQEANWDVFTQQFITAHPAVVQAFVCDTDAAQAAFLADPTASWRLLANKLGLSQAAVKVAFPRGSVVPPAQMLTAAGLGSPSVEPELAASTAAIGKVLVQEGDFPKAPTVADVENMIDRTFAKRVLAGQC
jgi:ABC-type nitrate/sulfonate/bicarbonate transport system substrate-binding protein